MSGLGGIAATNSSRISTLLSPPSGYTANTGASNYSPYSSTYGFNGSTLF